MPHLLTGHKIKPQYDFDYVALDLLAVYPEDSGTYTCTARNALGEATTSAQVKISGKCIMSIRNIKDSIFDTSLFSMKANFNKSTDTPKHFLITFHFFETFSPHFLDFVI